jgi:hypothetical protein
MITAVKPRGQRGNAAPPGWFPSTRRPRKAMGGHGWARGVIALSPGWAYPVSITGNDPMGVGG